ncbi:MAG: hypothetical protein PHE47_02800 [Oscillospiraceae bacterium]|nr:hypothetical protein [Oscillospiraceae bacterium]
MSVHYSYIGLALVVGVVLGGLLGLVPLICGLVKKRTGLAISGFFACMVGGIVLGIFLAVPMCILFTVLIFVTKPQGGTFGAPYGPYPGQAPYQGPAQQYDDPSAKPAPEKMPWEDPDQK